MNSSFGDFVSCYKSRTDAHLQTLLGSLDPQGTSLIQAMQYSALNGGKRVRPLLAYAAAAAVDRVNPTTDDFACAIECIHVYSLIHDDLPAMDNDTLRRGKATCHIAFDEATAILAGDALHSFAFEIIGNAASTSDSVKIAAVQVLTRAAGASGMIIGQAIDLESINRTLTLEQLETMHRHKTGALIEASVILGAMSADASEQALGALRGYATAIGLAFQVQDDILDVTSDTLTLGKVQGADETRNKPTYVSLMGVEEAKKKATSLKNSALESLSIFGDKAKILAALAEYVVNRSY